ncbi:hypothetical protein ACEV7T_25045, partial [Vibrio parahaemolyticus]
GLRKLGLGGIHPLTRRYVLGGINMQKKQIVKYILFFLGIGIVIAIGFDQLFFRGKLIGTHHGVVLSSWDNTDAPGKSRSRAAVKLEHGEVIQVICKSICIEGKVVIVEQYKPLFGSYSNYYSSLLAP